MNTFFDKDRVRFVNNRLHQITPEFFPCKNTVGVIIACYDSFCEIQWPKGSTSKDDRWFVDYKDIRKVEE